MANGMIQFDTVVHAVSCAVILVVQGILYINSIRVTAGPTRLFFFQLLLATCKFNSTDHKCCCLSVIHNEYLYKRAYCGFLFLRARGAADIVVNG